MALDPISLAFGLLGGGGGSTTQTTNVTTTNSLQNAFNPVSNVNLGGGIASSPSGSPYGSPTANSNQAVTPDAGQGGMPFYGDYGGGAASTGGGDLLSGNMIYLLIGGVVLYYVMKEK